MTTPNKITIGRVLLVPFFIVQVIYYSRTGDEWLRMGAFFTFALASISDAMDGFIARRYHQHSELGAVLDPLADKLLLFSAVILLSLENNHRFDRIPVWLTVTILSRDTILLIGLGVLYFTVGEIKLRPLLSSKAATVLQMAVVLWTLLQWPAGVLRWLADAAGLLTGGSGLVYLIDGLRRLNAHPSSAAAPRPP
jgi:cardiolipin synthase (CMP-forming)